MSQKLSCIIIDDERGAIKLLKRYISKLPNLELIGDESNPLIGIEIVKDKRPDIVFLDIEMDEMNGLEVMKIIGGISYVIFCTAYSEFAVASYELWAVDYLMKPIEFNRFVMAVQRVGDLVAKNNTDSANAKPNDYILVKAGQRGKMLRIDLDDIDYVEAMSNYIAFYRGTQKTLVYLSLKEVEERLPASHFMRVHKSFIIALNRMASIENNSVILKSNSRPIPIGANYKDVFLERMKRKLME